MRHKIRDAQRQKAKTRVTITVPHIHLAMGVQFLESKKMAKDHFAMVLGVSRVAMPPAWAKRAAVVRCLKALADKLIGGGMSNPCSNR